MPKYVVSSDSPISVRDINMPGMPDLPDFGRPGLGLPGTPEHPWVPGQRPSLPPDWQHPEIPPLPPRDEWPPLPPGLEGGLPIPPEWGKPIVPLPPEVDPPGIWPPVRPEFPDLSGKSIALALIWVSRHAPVWAWVVIDHEEGKAALKEAFDKAKQAIKDRLPAGGVAGRPPQTKPPGG